MTGGETESGSRNLLYGHQKHGLCHTVSVKCAETRRNGSLYVMDKPFPRLKAYFESFGWNFEPHIRKGKFTRAGFNLRWIAKV